MMRIAHLIMTYTSPLLIERMIMAIKHAKFDFYIHVDKKIDITPFLYLSSLPGVYFIQNRTEVRWAGYNTILATFKSIKEICARKINYGYINFISGQDYPLKSAAHIYDFFLKNKRMEFVAYKDYKKDWQEGMIRVKRYSMENFRFKGKYFVERVINRIMPHRKLPYNYNPYGDSMFWMLSPECASYVVEKVMNDPSLNRFFRYTWGSDEFVFQTILMNSEYKERLVNNNYRYIDWSAGGSHPKVLGIEDYEKLKNSEALFGRKFNIDTDAKIIDKLDKLISS
ncbi:MAG: beta-1,6-N-acetylglucosaminyltransferase [Niabella sp.]